MQHLGYFGKESPVRLDGAFFLISNMMRKLTIIDGHTIWLQDYEDDQIDDQIVKAYTGIMITMVTGRLSQQYFGGEA